MSLSFANPFTDGSKQFPFTSGRDNAARDSSPEVMEVKQTDILLYRDQQEQRTCSSIASRERSADLEEASGVRWAQAEQMRKDAMRRALQKEFAGDIVERRKYSSIKVANKEEDPKKIRDQTRLVLWTDGSHRETSTGAAVVWHSVDESDCGRWRCCNYALNMTFDSSDAEFFALSEAAKIAFQIYQQKLKTDDPLRKVRIYTDSVSVIDIIRKSHERASKYDLQIAKLKLKVQMLVEAGVDVDIRWVKGHSGVRGNAIADEMAGKASKNPAGADEMIPNTSEAWIVPRLKTKKAIKKERKARKERRESRNRRWEPIGWRAQAEDITRRSLAQQQNLPPFETLEMPFAFAANQSLTQPSQQLVNDSSRRESQLRAKLYTEPYNTNQHGGSRGEHPSEVYTESLNRLGNVFRHNRNNVPVHREPIVIDLTDD